MKEINANNSKKLIIGISILFCTVILIIGATTAYFTQSDAKEIGNIVSTNQVTLHYDDNDDYMLGDLIPINEEDVETAYNNKCKDDNGYNVCSIYQFTITNTGNVVQDIIINLETKVNGFTNLKFKLYDLVTNNEVLIEKNSLSYNTEEEILLVNNLTLDTSNNKSNTYELVFYIFNDPYNDQSHLDAGQSFSASIKVNSITTGEYIIKEVGEEKKDCWIFDENDTTKVNTFNGFEEDGSVKTHCETYFDENDGNYIVTIPSTYDGKEIKTIGNKLFAAFRFDIEKGEMIVNEKYKKIKEINIGNGITTIEDGIAQAEGTDMYGTFMGIGFNSNNATFVDNFELKVNLPNSLTKIGIGAFKFSAVKKIEFPSNLERIESEAFSFTLLNYNVEGAPLIVPASVNYIGVSALNSENIYFIKYMGTRGNLDKLGNKWYSGAQVTAIDD